MKEQLEQESIFNIGKPEHGETMTPANRQAAIEWAQEDILRSDEIDAGEYNLAVAFLEVLAELELKLGGNPITSHITKEK